MAYALAGSPAKTAQSKTAGTTLATLGSFSVGAPGNLIVIAFAMDNAAGAVSASDTDGAVYTVRSDVTNANGVRTVILSAVAIVDSGNCQFTVSHPSVTARAMVVKCFSGNDLSGPFDQQNTGTTDGSASTTSGSITPSQDNELIIGVTGAEDTNATGSPTEPGWATFIGKIGTTTGGAASNIYVSMAHEIQSAATARTYDPTLAGAADNANCIASFTVPATGGLPFDAQQGSLHDDPFSIQAVQQQAVARGAFYMRRWQRRPRSGLIVPARAYC